MRDERRETEMRESEIKYIYIYIYIYFKILLKFTLDLTLAFSNTDALNLVLMESTYKSFVLYAIYCLVADGKSVFGKPNWETRKK